MQITTTVSTHGKTTVIINEWRNTAATAFCELTITDVWGATKTVSAKSQGPSAGGYCKPTQARARLLAKMKLDKTIDWKAAQYLDRVCAQIAIIAESARVTGCKPVWNI